MPQSEEEKRKQQEQLILAVAALLAVQGAPASGVANKVATLLTAAGIVVPFAALLEVTRLALSKPSVYGPPAKPESGTGIVQRREEGFRASYLLAASRRVARDVREGLTLAEAMRREKKHFDAHLLAQKRRFEAARSVDGAARRHGDLVGWYAKMDSRTSDECRAANGKNFQVSRPPAIGFPGSVHRFCRCKAGRPHPGAATLRPNARKVV